MFAFCMYLVEVAFTSINTEYLGVDINRSAGVALNLFSLNLNTYHAGLLFFMLL